MSEKKSALERFAEEFGQWIEEDKDINEAKVRATEMVDSTKVNDYSKELMKKNIEECDDITSLVHYLYSSLLKYIGLGTQ